MNNETEDAQNNGKDKDKKEEHEMNEHVKRMSVEREELVDKAGALSHFIEENEIFLSLSREQQWLVQEQLHAMRCYARVLSRRITLS